MALLKRDERFPEKGAAFVSLQITDPPLFYLCCQQFLKNSGLVEL